MSEMRRPPARVVKRDGRVAPFEPEKIQHTLFAAAERLGEPNAFLARELTDGVLHFLARGPDEPPPSTAEVAETVVKVVREFGYPDLANSYAELVRTDARPVRSPIGAATAGAPGIAMPATGHDFLGVQRHFADERLRAISLGAAWPREFVAAHRDQILCLTGLATPFEMAGTTLGPFARSGAVGIGLLETFLAAREYTGGFVAIDGPEHELVCRAGAAESRADAFVEELQLASRLTGLIPVVNLNCASAPAWAVGGPAGPLFPGDRGANPAELDDIRVGLLRRLAAASLLPGDPPVAVFWHVQPTPDRGDAPPLLPGALDHFAASASLEFVFDRARAPICLGPGLDRRHPAVLAEVGIDLPALVLQLGGGPLDRGLFVRKLGSLARFAKSAGHVRQDFLRKHARPPAKRAFLLERARLVVIPLGLNAAVRAVLGADATSPGNMSEYSRQVLQAIRNALEGDVSRSLEAVVDSPLQPAFTADGCTIDTALRSTEIGPGGPEIHLNHSIRAAGGAHLAAGGGRLTFRHFSNEAIEATPQLAEAIALARQVGVHRLRVEKQVDANRAATSPTTSLS